MGKFKDILHKGFAVFFIGLMLLISFHNLVDYHAESSHSHAHNCAICHQVMIEETPTVSIPKLLNFYTQKFVVKAKIGFTQKNQLKHLFVRGPPFSFYFSTI
ncbi:MAG: hypothetical protein WC994_04115 [Brumimicrobium sp.]